MELNWIKPPWKETSDGPGAIEWDWPEPVDTFLAALRVRQSGGPFHWEYAVVTIDENCQCEVNGDPWGWSRSDIEWIARILQPGAET